MKSSIAEDRGTRADLGADNPSVDEDYGRARISAEALAPLKRRSDARGLSQLAAHVTVLVLTGAAVWTARDTAWVLPAMLVHGLALVCLFAALHETVHRTAFATRWMNDALARFAGVVLFLGADFFRAFHFAHHRFTQQPDRDPELEVKDVHTLRGYLWYMSGISYWIRAVSGLARAARGRVDAPFVSDAVRPQVVREARLMLTLYAAVALGAVAGFTAPLLLWWGPLVLAQPFWRAWLLAEHSGCADGGDIYASTRTTRSNALVRAALWQMPYHTAHHAYPGVPFHALPALDSLLRGGEHPDPAGPATAGPVSAGYGAFHRDWLRAIRDGRARMAVPRGGETV